MTAEIDTATLLRFAGDALTAFFRAAPGFEARLRREAWLVMTGGTGAFGNCVTVVEPGDTAAALLREFVALIRSHGAPGIVFLPPGADAGQVAVCTELGLAMEAPTPFMVCCAADLPAPRGAGPFRVERIADAPQQAAEILAAAFAMPCEDVRQCLADGLLTEPAVTFYAARLDDRMVSTVAVSRIGALAYVTIMATAPDLQRRGAGSAVLAHALAEHVATGVTHVALVASDEGEALYKRFGFRTAFALTTWEIPARPIDV